MQSAPFVQDNPFPKVSITKDLCVMNLCVVPPESTGQWDMWDHPGCPVNYIGVLGRFFGWDFPIAFVGVPMARNMFLWFAQDKLV